ncbi:hypothetical protein BZM26_37540 [Paraburkholderia strydomiana]|nr:hypothetical protein BZM26_37540 [Paraburkholderia strydomiana]
METPTISEAAALISARRLSPVELVEHCLGRVQCIDNSLRSFITVTAERARIDARSAEARMMKGQLRGNLDGIPIAHKDVYCTRGVLTTAHSRLLRDWVPAKSARVVDLLEREGTAMLGKLATHEFALGGPSFDLPWPPARNPWDTRRFTSGSSSGTAAAVAAGLILGGTGTDTAGSIRAPAAHCGVVGLKPTYGLCSRRGILPLASTLDHSGPIAWTVRDCALLLQAMAGYDDMDPASVKRPPVDYSINPRPDLNGLRIGVVASWHEVENAASSAVQAGLENALRIWRGMGAHIKDVVLPPLDEYQAASVVIILCEAYAQHELSFRKAICEYGEVLRDRLLIGATLSGADYVHALRRRRQLSAITTEVSEAVDLLVTAGASAEAPLMDAVTRWGSLSKPGFHDPFNLTGWPAICVCSGYGEGGLPVSVQLAAKPFQEALLIQVAGAFEEATGFRAIRPTSTTVAPAERLTDTSRI